MVRVKTFSRSYAIRYTGPTKTIIREEIWPGYPGLVYRISRNTSFSVATIAKPVSVLTKIMPPMPIGWKRMPGRTCVSLSFSWDTSG